MKRYYYITPDDYMKAYQNGIPEYVVWQRVNNSGWDIDRAITEKVIKKTKYTEKEKEIIKKNEITTRIVSDRLKLGWDRKKAISTPKVAKNKCNKPKRSVFSDEIIGKAKNNGICYNTFRDRVKRLGWNWEEAATIPVMCSGHEFKEKHIWRAYTSVAVDQLMVNK